MEKVTTVGLDLAKSVFQVHGVNAAGGVVVRRKLRRSALLDFFAALPPTFVGMEACGGAHYWARELTRLGHTVRLMPPAYVKPYVMCGWPPRCKGFLVWWRRGRVRSCVRPRCAVRMTAGPDEIRNPASNQAAAFHDALT
jgi:hypothetical protein